MRKQRKRGAIIGLMLCAAVCLSGCGGSETGETGVSIPLLEMEEDKPLGTASGERPGLDAAAPSDEDTASAEREEPREVQITISAAGDVSLGNYVGQGYDLSFDQTYEKVQDKGYFFENVRDLFTEDDFTIVNLEGVLTESEMTEPGRTFNIKGKPEYAAMLSAASVEAVSMGNNHRMDFGEAGVQDTISALTAEGIPYAYNENTGMMEVDGIRIAWISVNEASQGEYVERYLDEGIPALREAGADLVLVCCHWGIEREYDPEDYQKELGRKCIDWGADLVLGHHPHVLQGIECYQGKYIVYSLGNFCFSANRNPADKDTMIFQQTFTFTEVPEDAGTVTGMSAGGESSEGESSEGETAGGEMSDMELWEPQWQLAAEASARVIPCRISSVTARNNYQPTPLTGEEGQQVINRLNEFSREFGVVIEEDGDVTYPVGE